MTNLLQITSENDIRDHSQGSLCSKRPEQVHIFLRTCMDSAVTRDNVLDGDVDAAEKRTGNPTAMSGSSVC